jgi:protein associated with RNAse G/E
MNEGLQNSATNIIVRSLKYDGTLSRSWPAAIESMHENMIVLRGVFEQTVQHEGLGNITAGTVSLEYFWSDQWYNVFKFVRPGGELHCHYCNIALPAKWSERELSFVDLDVDIVVDADNSVKVLDEDEFEANRLIFGYPADIVAGVRNAVEEVKALVSRLEFPFNLARNLK